MRRKRNLIARDLKMNKIYHEKVVRTEEQKKRPRQKLRPLDINEESFDD